MVHHAWWKILIGKGDGNGERSKKLAGIPSRQPAAQDALMKVSFLRGERVQSAIRDRKRDEERIDDYPYSGGDSRGAFSFDLGWMKNISERRALGFSGYALVSDPTTRLGIRARYRRWLSRKTSIDVSPGILLSGEDSGIEYDPPGFVLGATLNAGDLVALTVDAEYARNLDLVHDTTPLQWEERTDVAWRAGAKLGSGLGVLATAGLFGLLLFIGLSGGFE